MCMQKREWVNYMRRVMSKLTTLLSPFLPKIEAFLDGIFYNTPETDQLEDCIRYSLTQGGKRLRPSLSLMVAEAIGSYNVLPAACAVELFHTASLLADDLPCMDDAHERRGRKVAHHLFGEATTLLASFSLIAKGYHLIGENRRLIMHLSDAEERVCLALEAATETTGYLGASGGQFLDLYPPNHSKEVLEKIINLKTGALFSLASTMGWIFGGGSLEKVSQIKEVGLSLGILFQLVDDLSDYEEDLKNERINYAVCLGVEALIERVFELKDRIEVLLQEMNYPFEQISNLTYLLSRKVAEFAKHISSAKCNI